jgi:hypothetical protein
LRRRQRRRRHREFAGFAFTVELGLLWDFEQILAVGAAMDFCQCLLEWIRH